MTSFFITQESGSSGSLIAARGSGSGPGSSTRYPELGARLARREQRIVCKRQAPLEDESPANQQLLSVFWYFMSFTCWIDGLASKMTNSCLLFECPSLDSPPCAGGGQVIEKVRIVSKR
jgi:hypothetical protein